jgi:hypothetical protein
MLKAYPMKGSFVGSAAVGICTDVSMYVVKSVRFGVSGVTNDIG